MVIPGGSRLRPAEIGGLMALGLRTVSVVRKPRIAIISSGDEVVPPEAEPLPGQVRDVNTYTLSALIEKAGGSSVACGIAPDRPEALRELLDQALRTSEGVLITAGSSASTRDLTAQAIQQAGQPGILIHGLNIRPGKPTILAVCRGKPVMGLPGNPVSALVIAWLFVIPLVERLQHVRNSSPRNQVMARLTTNLPSQAGREDWVPVQLAFGDGQITAEPVFFKSNLIFNLVKADGLLYVPAEVTGYSAGATVLVYIV
jgi:molybdopterin molybdotransferase